ncbi:MAG: thiamine biosynthesis protein [Jatrophihabitans sp.]|nr:thiamine biosynthesis protein [Jatrophihabitans sp.]
MGTVFSIDVRSSGVESAVMDDVVAYSHRIDAIFSTYRPGSDISRLGRGEIRLAACAPEVREVLRRCAELRVETGGYFTAHPSGRLDPSGYVKGWAIETISDLLVSAGSTSHCVNGGGDVQCIGEAAPGRPWRVGVSHPLQPLSYVGVVESAGPLAVATSGTAERGAHIVDPHSGRCPTETASVTVVGSSIGLVDAYATAALAMGRDAEGWLDRQPGVSGIVVGADGSSTWLRAG